MAISLKKHTPGAGEQESARLNDVNSNWGTIEQAINDLQANASLLAIDVTPKPGFAVAGKLYKVGRIYIMPLTINGSIPAAWTPVATIPSTYAPTSGIYVPAATGGATFGMGSISNNGTINAYAPGGTGQINFILAWAK
ncbi:MAG TPA: hypothetical protein GX728_03260 [Clostridiaceae bacterium]|nr:hypothetical protein [Clostridiaceae bacterium]